MQIDEKALKQVYFDVLGSDSHPLVAIVYRAIEAYEAAKADGDNLSPTKDQPVELSRKDFEDWYEADAYPCELSYRFSKDGDGDYTYSETASQWRAWQAASSRSILREVVEDEQARIDHNVVSVLDKAIRMLGDDETTTGKELREVYLAAIRAAKSNVTLHQVAQQRDCPHCGGSRGLHSFENSCLFEKPDEQGRRG